MKKSCTRRLTNHFSGCLYFSAGQLYRTLERMAFDAFSSLSLAPTQAFLVLALNEAGQEGATPSELSEVMGLDRSTITRLVAPLEKKNLVRSVVHGRFKTIRLTLNGRKMLPEIKRAWSALDQAYSERLGEKEARAMNLVLRKNLLPL